MPPSKPEPLPEELASKMRDFLAESERAWDALPRREKLRRRFIGRKEDLALRKHLLLGGRLYTDEQVADFPALAEAQREWDAFPRWRRLLEVSGLPTNRRRLGEVVALVLVVAVCLYFFVISPLLIRTGHMHDPCGGGQSDPSSPNFNPDCGPPNLQDNP